MIYAIDFDGTIVENEFPKIGKLKKDAVTFIKNLKAAGHTFILNTCRSNDRLKEAVVFLKENDLAPDLVNENTKEVIAYAGADTRKIYADVYIDDKNAGGLVWPTITIKNAHDEDKKK